MSTYSNYQNAYKKASVNTLDQNKLIIMLYDGAIKNANFAVQYMESGEIEKVHDSLIKTKNIVTELLATLNMEQGGEIAKNLKSLYSYMFSLLIEANMEKNTEPVVTVIDLLKELSSAWFEINKKNKDESINQNKSRMYTRAKIFEVGPNFFKSINDLQENVASAIAYGSSDEENWLSSKKIIDFEISINLGSGLSALSELSILNNCIPPTLKKGSKINHNDK